MTTTSIKGVLSFCVAVTVTVVMAYSAVTVIQKNNAAAEKAVKESQAIGSEVSTDSLKDGEYEGTATGYGGPLTVRITIKGGKLTDIKVVSHTETPEYFSRASAVIGKILNSGNVNVDSVSGATISSNAIKEAVADALRKAGSKQQAIMSTVKKDTGNTKGRRGNVAGSFAIANANLKDGVYTGSGQGFNGPIRVRVTVSGGNITNVEILSHSDDAPYFNRAKAVIGRLLGKPGKRVDTVSGATYSSRGIIYAVRNALANAGKTNITNTNKPNNNNNNTNTTYQLGTVTATGLNVRSGAGVGYSIVGAYRKGDQVKIYAQSTANGMTWGQTDKGWVSMNYIQLVNNNNNNNSNNGTVLATGTVRANTNLNVRNGAGVGYTRVGNLTGGTAVNIYERVTVNGAEWGRIGTNQWVCMAYIVLNNSNNNNNNTTTTGTGTVISSTGLNIRVGAGATYNRVGTLTPGSQVTIYEVVTNGNQQWGRIGINQWVCMTYVRMNSGNNNGNITIPSTGCQGRVTTNMNVRAGAGTKNAIVGRLTAGSTVTIYELTTVNGVYWGRIASGWVCMSYIQMTTNSGTVTWQ